MVIAEATLNQKWLEAYSREFSVSTLVSLMQFSEISNRYPSSKMEVGGIRAFPSFSNNYIQDWGHTRVVLIIWRCHSLAEESGDTVHTEYTAMSLDTSHRRACIQETMLCRWDWFPCFARDASWRTAFVLPLMGTCSWLWFAPCKAAAVPRLAILRCILFWRALWGRLWD